jgi:hypothetical protein
LKAAIPRAMSSSSRPKRGIDVTDYDYR